MSQPSAERLQFQDRLLLYDAEETGRLKQNIACSKERCDLLLAHNDFVHLLFDNAPDDGQGLQEVEDSLKHACRPRAALRLTAVLACLPVSSSRHPARDTGLQISYYMQVCEIGTLCPPFSRTSAQRAMHACQAHISTKVARMLPIAICQGR